MSKKSGHASNEKVMEQQSQARALEGGVNVELKAMFDGILKKEKARQDINDSIREDVARINKKYDIPAKTSRRVLGLLKMDKEAMAQYETSLADAKRLLGMQNDLFVEQDVRDAATVVPGAMLKKDPMTAASQAAIN